MDSPGCCISFWVVCKHTEQWVCCAECRRGQAADTETSPPPSPLSPQSLHYRTSAGWAFPRKAGRTYTHKLCVVYGSIETLLLALRIPVCLVLLKKPLRAVEPKTKLWTGCSSMGFKELLYQNSCSAMLMFTSICLYPFLLSTFTIPGYFVIKTQLLRSTVLIEISLKMLALMKNTTCKLHPT